MSSSRSRRLIAGAMSGTSADGVDVAIVEVEGRGLAMTARLVQHAQQPYSVELRQTLHAIREHGEARLSDLARCAREISLHYAAAVREALALANLTAADLAAVAAHGQTLFHDPPNTIQWIDPALLAAEAGCQVISDFRRADCAAGGQGAPLVPFADYILFRDATRHRVLLNIGGVANLTYLPAGGSIDQLVAFDTGPGNCISDWLCREFDPQGPGYDPNGTRAMRGRPSQPLVEDMILQHDYFRRDPPKSTDVPMMLEHYRVSRERTIRKHGPIQFSDELASACRITAMAIHESLDHPGGAGPGPWDQMIVSGGGSRNAAIMRELRSICDAGRGQAVMTTDDLGVPSQAKEAIAFALLGAATLDEVPANVPSCTGARRAVVLGSITP